MGMHIARFGALGAGWLACGILTFLGWYQMFESIQNDGKGIIPAGMMGIMWILTGLGAGLAGNGISAALKP